MIQQKHFNFLEIVLTLGLTIVYFASFALQGYLMYIKVVWIIPYLGILFPNMLLVRAFDEVLGYERKCKLDL